MLHLNDVQDTLSLLQILRKQTLEKSSEKKDLLKLRIAFRSQHQLFQFLREKTQCNFLILLLIQIFT